jgi:hypothetical protein
MLVSGAPLLSDAEVSPSDVLFVSSELSVLLSDTDEEPPLVLSELMPLPLQPQSRQAAASRINKHFFIFLPHSFV